jgi:hypothetical protein
MDAHKVFGLPRLSKISRAAMSTIAVMQAPVTMGTGKARLLRRSAAGRKRREHFREGPNWTFRQGSGKSKLGLKTVLSLLQLSS